jgi:Leucine-rich repeat (LRR) protein
MNGNKISEIGAIKVPNLLELHLNENKVEKIEFEEHAKIEVLTLDDNRIADMAIIKNMPALKTLSVARNKLKIFNGLGGLGALVELSVAGNEIAALGEEDYPVIETLEKVDLSDNKIPNLEFIKKFEEQPKLVSLKVSGNPICFV